MRVHTDVHAMTLNVNRTKNQYWFWIHGHAMDLFLSKMMAEKIQISISHLVRERLPISLVQLFWMANSMSLVARMAPAFCVRQANYHFHWKFSMIFYQQNDRLCFIQISKINGCSLERIADLPKEFKYGACGTYNFPEERVMFCFGSTMDQEKQCFRWVRQNLFIQLF